MNQELDTWRGSFGDDYSDRNAPTDDRIADCIKMWEGMLPCLSDDPPQSAVEIGCNMGINLRALSKISDMTLYGVEPNARALASVAGDGVVPADRAFESHGAAIPLDDAAVEMAFTIGVLIHVNPDVLPAVADEMYRVSSKYILLSEYFAVEPEEREYRGRTGLLYKRDFGGFFLDRFPDLKVVDYGFFWKRTTGLDNLTWWVLRK